MRPLIAAIQNVGVLGELPTFCSPQGTIVQSKKGLRKYERPLPKAVLIDDRWIGRETIN